jgi:chorismate synthase
MLRFLTAGESHGKSLILVLEGMVAGMPLTADDINTELARRQKGYGRGKRMSIEKDRAEIISGIRAGKTTGGPIGIMIKNKDWENWKEIMDVEKEFSGGERFVPRPGHADLAGVIKYGFSDIRNVIERSSARETAARVSIGAICRKLLSVFGINFYSRVIQIGKIADDSQWSENRDSYKKIENSPVRNIKKEKEMEEVIDTAKKKGESTGGIFEITVEGVCPGLGSYVHWDRRLDAGISFVLTSIPGIKGVEIGKGFEGAGSPGSDFHDEIYYEKGKGVYRNTNNAGGIEGGITNGSDIWVKCIMKPIPTLKKPLKSFNINTMKTEKTFYERSDICAVIPAAVVGENFIAYPIANAFMAKFGGDSLQELKNNYKNYIVSIKKFWNR